MNPHDIHHVVAKEPTLITKIIDAVSLVACVIMGGLIYIIY